MNRRDKKADGWAFVASRVRNSTDATTNDRAAVPPPGFVEQVLTLAKEPVLGMSMGPEREQERVVAWAAGFALAASLLVSIWNWPTLEVIWTDPGPPVGWPVSMEPLP